MNHYGEMFEGDMIKAVVIREDLEGGTSNVLNLMRASKCIARMTSMKGDSEQNIMVNIEPEDARNIIEFLQGYLQISKAREEIGYQREAEI